MDNSCPNARQRIEVLESLVRRNGGVPPAGSVLHGQTTLVAGVSPAPVSVPGLSLTSSIVLLKRVQIGDANTVEYVALDADRAYGAGGTFKARAIVSAGTPNVADGSTLDFIVIL